MKLYRIYTERPDAHDQRHIIAEVAKKFDGVTFYETLGLWKGQTEDSLVIELIADKSRRFDVEHWLVPWLRGYLSQESVMFTEQEVDVSFYPLT